MTPEELLQHLKGNSSVQKQRSLDIIHEICREQYTRGSKDFSIATIGRLSEEKGGPKAQPIRNKGGDDYRALISVWAKHTGGSTKKAPKLSESPIYAVLSKIDDPAVRAVMGSILAENTKLKGQLNVLKHHAEVIIDKRPQQSSQTIEVFPPSANLIDSEYEALTHAISDALIKNEGWTVETNGQVKNAKGRVLYKPGYATAIKKVLLAVKKYG